MFKSINIRLSKFLYPEKNTTTTSQNIKGVTSKRLVQTITFTVLYFSACTMRSFNIYQIYICKRISSGWLKNVSSRSAKITKKFNFFLTALIRFDPNTWTKDTCFKLEYFSIKTKTCLVLINWGNVTLFYPVSYTHLTLPTIYSV